MKFFLGSRFYFAEMVREENRSYIRGELPDYIGEGMPTQKARYRCGGNVFPQRIVKALPVWEVRRRPVLSGIAVMLFI